MMLDVKLFARAREVAGTDQVRLDLGESACVADLRTALAVRFPQMRSLVPSLLVAVGNDYADDRTLLAQDTEVACFPPVSGG